jgi:TRAP-type C4-dicarboxylate transport system substrate-binding protein
MERKKPILVITICLLSLVALMAALVGCEGTAETTTATKTETSTATETATETATAIETATETETVVEPVIKLKFAYGSPEPAPGVFDYQVVIANWCQRVEEESNGRVQIDIYPAESLLQYEDIYRGVATGISEIGAWSPHYDVAAFSLTSGFTLPGIPWGSYEAIYKVHRGTFEAIPALQAEFKDVKILGYASLAEGIIMLSGHEAQVPADLKGLKLAASAAEIPRAEALGAVGVSLSAADRYLAIERGTVDGAIMVWGAVRAFKLYEVCDWFLEGIAQPRSNMYPIMNQEVFDSLPADIQQIIEDLIPWFSQELARAYTESGAAGRDLSVEAGRTIYSPTPEELELWIQALEPLQDEWVEEREAAGLPAREMLDEMLRIAREVYDL